MEAFIHLDLVNFITVYQDVKMVQLEDAGTVNQAVGRSSLSCFQLTKNLQQDFNPTVLNLPD